MQNCVEGGLYCRYVSVRKVLRSCRGPRLKPIDDRRRVVGRGADLLIGDLDARDVYEDCVLLLWKKPQCF